MHLFPKYSEVVRVVFGQVLANSLFEKIDNSIKLKTHAEFVSAINTLIPNCGKIEFELNQYDAWCQVGIKIEGNESFFIRVEGNLTTMDTSCYVI